MAESSEKFEVLSQSVASGSLPKRELCSLIEAYPGLIEKVPQEQTRSVLICIAMNQNIDALEEARKRGLITPENAMELFLESTQYGAEMPVTQWFTDNYSFDTAQAQRIIENMDFPNLDALVVMAKKLPLSEEGQRKLLHMVDDAAAYVLTPLNVKVDGDLFSVSIKPGQYPLLYNYRSKAFRQYKNAKRSAVDSKYVKPSNEILTEDELEQYEHVLRQLGWYLSTFEQNYGGWAGTAIQDQAGLTGEDLIHRDIKTGRASLNIGYDALVRAYRDVREKERKRELR